MMSGVGKVILPVLSALITVLLLCFSFTVEAQQPTHPSVVSPASTASLKELLRQPVVLRGSLGADKIQVTLRPKMDEDGFEGSYFVFGQGTQILLAGEVDENDFMMEQSHNAHDVSGQWEGTFSHGVLSGTWSTLDGAVTKPFTLKVGS